MLLQKALSLAVFPYNTLFNSYGGSLIGSTVFPFAQHELNVAVGLFSVNFPQCVSSLNISAPHAAQMLFMLPTSCVSTVDSSKVSKLSLPMKAFLLQ